MILYFIYKTKGHITKTQLVKFLYLADLYSAKWTGKQLTDLDWYYYLRGPWHEDIDVALQRMEERCVVRTEPSGDAQLIRVADDKLNTQVAIEELNFPQSLELTLENIQREWAGPGKLNELLGYVYNTAPMIDAQTSHTPSDKTRLDLLKEREQLLQKLEVE